MVNKEQLYANDALTTELLAILAEECGEVIQAVGKCLRHGVQGRYKDGTINIEQVEIELGDVLASISILKDYGVLDEHVIDVATVKKLVKYDNKDYLHNV